ncbi:MAG: hypothetical protein LBQ36_00500 [Synergistaceae bacterium]|jgi:hypothetical protein|nr:hypothetical protein [Synergistaceae bacterium]
MKKRAAIVLALLMLLHEAPARAALSANAAFTLLGKVPPGEYMPDAKAFLGLPSSERSIDANKNVKVTRWGKQSDSWIFDVLHDEDTVRATRIVWRTKTKSEQQTIFSQLTTAGKGFFGKPATFRSMDEAEWSDFDGRWIVRAKIETDIAKGVTLLSGIRNNVMDSASFGF